MKEELQRHVQQLIDDLVESGEEIGLQVAAYIDSELAVDAWAGVADEATGRPLDGDTLFTSWSTTKGVHHKQASVKGRRTISSPGAS